MVKTFAELAMECGVDRTTFHKAIKRGLLSASVHKSAGIWLADDEHPEFKAWLDGTGKQKPGRPRKSSIVHSSSDTAPG